MNIVIEAGMALKRKERKNTESGQCSNKDLVKCTAQILAYYTCILVLDIKIETYYTCSICRLSFYYYYFLPGT